jgi:hypothetical protein
MNHSKKIIEVHYPLGSILFHEGILLVMFNVVFGFMEGGITIWMLLISLVYSAIVYFFGQKKYCNVIVFRDRIELLFPYSFYLKSKEYFFSDIERVVFKFSVGTREIPSMRWEFNNGKSKLIVFPEFELDQIRDVLMGIGIRTVNKV